MEEGRRRIEWRSANGPRSGIIIGKHKLGWKVMLDNGKMVIVHPNSIINNKDL